MANALSLYLSKYFTEETKRDAQDILFKNKPESIRDIHFSEGKICLDKYVLYERQYIKTFIPGDIGLVDVCNYKSGSFLTLDHKEFIPNEATAISLYFYFIQTCISREEYFIWLHNILVNHYSLNILSFNPVLESILGSRIYLGTGIGKFIIGSNRLHRDVLDFYEWIERKQNQWESE